MQLEFKTNPGLSNPNPFSLQYTMQTSQSRESDKFINNTRSDHGCSWQGNKKEKLTWTGYLVETPVLVYIVFQYYLSPIETQ